MEFDNYRYGLKFNVHQMRAMISNFNGGMAGERNSENIRQWLIKQLNASDARVYTGYGEMFVMVWWPTAELRTFYSLQVGV